MEVVIPTMDFDFNSAHPSPYSSAPSTPKRFGDYYCSAPTSPTNLSDFYHDFDDFFVSNTSSPIPKSSSPNAIAKKEDDFAFDVADESEKTVLPAEELFDAGRIRPLNPPQQKRSRLGGSEARKSPSTGPISHLRGAFSPKKKKKEADTFENERGRERNPSFSSSNSGRRGARSLSPYRVSKYPWEEEQNLQQSTKQSSIVPKPPPTPSPSTSASALSSSSSKGSTRKWRLKDFFLFRSASEGRATDKDPLKKYTGLFWKHEDAKSSSFRSIEGSTSSRRRGPAISAHELHYTVNRAVSEDLKKKTFLPYKQGILGRLAFNPAVHALANGFGFSRK